MAAKQSPGNEEIASLAGERSFTMTPSSKNMLDRLLSLFPPHTHPLILVQDPDGLMADESLLAALVERGFTIIQETDPILLHQRIEQVKPFASEKPVILITPDELNALPYDLWQQGHLVTLALHTYFPNLAYPVIRTLTPVQRACLSEATQPKERLGERGTIKFLLQHVFGIQTGLLGQPAWFILWLDDYHQKLTSLPPLLADALLDRLRSLPVYADWPLPEILLDRPAFQSFMQGQWRAYLAQQTGQAIGELSGAYLLNFERDQSLQDALPRFVRSNSLALVEVQKEFRLPAWTLPAVFVSDEDPRPRRMAELLETIQDSLAGLSADSRWEDWQAVAHHWGELTNLRHAACGTSGLDPAFEKKYAVSDAQTHLDKSFLSWLRSRYSPLAAQRLPVPHHVHHIPHYLDYLRSKGLVEKIALVILDGMSLSDWLLVWPAWNSRHADWLMKEMLVMAQIPTITAISRQSLVSGLRPVDFYAANGATLSEAKSWSAFWGREGLPENVCALLAINLERSDPSPEVTDPRMQALCLIERTLDDIMHGSVLGAADYQASVNLWALANTNCHPTSAKLESLLGLLLEQGYTLFLTSDHGHCEAYGIGTPSEGLSARTRGRRARLYTDRQAALHTQQSFNDTILWDNDGLLPAGLTAVLPAKRQAFVQINEVIITHGGTTLDEVVVPLIELRKKR